MTDEDVGFTAEVASSPKLDAAERDVARAQARFSADLERASYAGRKLTTSIVNSARPALVGVAFVTAAALIVAVWRSRKSGPARRFQAPESASVWRELARTAVMTLASSAGKHLAAHVIALSQEHAPRDEFNGERSKAWKAGAIGALALVSSLLLPDRAFAQNEFSVDVEAAYPSNDVHDDGLGVGARFGHEWDLVLLHLTPELGVSYHTFGGAPDAESFAVLAGGRLGLGFVIEPSAFLHAGIGHYGYDTVGGDVSQTGLAHELGFALDFTLLPVIDFGAHAAFAGIAGDPDSGVDALDWFAIGGHITFSFDDDDGNRDGD